MRFRDRRDAGRRLAGAVAELELVDPVVVGLPRGGVPVAAEIASRLGAPLDVILVRKLGVPWQPELAMGAIGEGGVRVLNEAVLADAGPPEEAIHRVEEAERAELEARAVRYRGDRPRVPLAGRSIVVVDDGIATGSTARAALQVARAAGAAKVVLAVPVAPPSTVAALASDADAIVCVAQPDDFHAVGQFYDDFTQTSDDEVVALLAGR